MTGEECNQIRTLLRKSPRTIWGYWPFIFPVLFAVACTAIVVGLVVYWETRMPDLEVLFKRGSKVAPIADSQMVREAVMSAASLITCTFVLLVFLARVAFQQVRLLRAAAKELGIEDSQKGGASEGQPIRPETSSTSAADGSRHSA